MSAFVLLLALMAVPANAPLAAASTGDGTTAVTVPESPPSAATTSQAPTISDATNPAAMDSVAQIPLFADLPFRRALAEQGIGASFDLGLPSLFHNTATGRRNTDNLVMTVLDGIGARADGSGVVMPGFAHELSDRQIATLGNYLTRHFGNPVAAVTIGQVRILRAGGPSSNLLLLARVALAIGVVILILIVFETISVLTRRLRRAREIDSVSESVPRAREHSGAAVPGPMSLPRHGCGKRRRLS